MGLKMCPADPQLSPGSMLGAHITVCLSHSLCALSPLSLLPQFIKFNLFLLLVKEIMWYFQSAFLEEEIEATEM